MGAVWQKNEVTAAKRRCDLLVQKSDGTLAPRGTDFIALGYVYISGVQSPNYALATGTLTNKRKPLVVADFTFTAAAATDLLTKVAHGLETGDGLVNVSNAGGALPGGLAAATSYWAIRVDADTFKLATSLANAYAGVAIDITSDGTGTQTLSDTASTQRGIDGHFTYEASQAETNHDAPETSVIIDGANYERSSGWGAFTTVQMDQAGSLLEQILEGAHTVGDGLRILVRGEIAKFSKTGNDYVIRNLADSKDSHHGTVTASGRTVAVIDDAT